MTDLINKMKQGDRDAIITGLSSGSVIDRVNAICFSVRNCPDDPLVIKWIYRSSGDERDVFGKGWGITVGAFADAALDVIGQKKYVGDNEHAKEMIESQFSFWYR